MRSFNIRLRIEQNYRRKKANKIQGLSAKILSPESFKEIYIKHPTFMGQINSK